MSEPAREVARVTGEVVTVGASSLMEVISRAASDPSTDVDKLERLLGMYERITGREAETAFNDAMNAAQEEMRPIAADAHNPQTKSRYASYAALDNALRPTYTRHGFSLSFNTEDGAPADHIRVVCRVAHRQGHKEHAHLDMPADGKGAKGGDVMTKTHATGAAITYGKRYLLGMIFNIAVGEDKDGNAPTRFVTAQQADQIEKLLTDTGANREAFLKYIGAGAVAEIPAQKFQGAMSALNRKREGGR
jgi:hypothetical protein